METGNAKTSSNANSDISSVESSDTENFYLELDPSVDLSNIDFLAVTEEMIDAEIENLLRQISSKSA